jgi:hypothetical protein
MIVSHVSSHYGRRQPSTVRSQGHGAAMTGSSRRCTGRISGIGATEDATPTAGAGHVERTAGAAGDP